MLIIIHLGSYCYNYVYTLRLSLTSVQPLLFVMLLGILAYNYDEIGLLHPHC